MIIQHVGTQTRRQLTCDVRCRVRFLTGLLKYNVWMSNLKVARMRVDVNEDPLSLVEV
jgi:hypothetical protein